MDVALNRSHCSLAGGAKRQNDLGKSRAERGHGRRGAQSRGGCGEGRGGRRLETRRSCSQSRDSIGLGLFSLPKELTKGDKSGGL